MKRNISKLLFYIFGTFIFFSASCTHNSVNPTIGEANSRSLYLQISTDSDLSTRSTEPGNFDAAINENKIDRLDIFFYQGEELKWHVEKVSYDKDAKTAEIALNLKAESLFDGAEQYDIYVVANGPARSEMTDKTLTQLKKIVHTQDFGVTNQKGNPENFLMDGKLPPKAVSLTDINLGTVNMKRAAAKIRVRIFKGSKIGGTVFTPYIAVKNYNKQTVLLQDGSPAPTDLFSDIDYTKAETEYTESLIELPGLSHLPIYSYENDWSKSENKANETYIMIRVDYKVDASSAMEGYFYKIPITPPTESTDSEKNYHRIERNHIYDIKVTIDEIGGDENNPVTLEANYEIKDWTTKEVALAVTEHHFLFVYPQKTEMINTSEHKLSFSSSKYPVSIKDEAVSYTYVNVKSGVEITETVIAGSEFYPEITVAAGSQLININSKIPNNNVPKDIVFTLTNGVEELDQKVQIRQYAPVYITYEMGDSSILRKKGEFTGETHLKNKALYTFNTMLPDGNAIIGFPPVDKDGCTDTTVEVSKMLSPSFMAASQLGATQGKEYAGAVSNCKEYWEASAGVKYSNWRLPTKAELAFMDRLQNDPNSVVTPFMLSEYYWAAAHDKKATQMVVTENTATHSTITEDFAPVRCVRDVR